MNILVLGGGGREHAICWAIRKSRKCSALFCIPGNAGISEIAVCNNLDLNKKNELIRFCKNPQFAVFIGFINISKIILLTSNKMFK